MSIHVYKLDTTHCKQQVPTVGLRMHYHQCERAVVKDGFCKQHHPDSVAIRRKKADVLWKKKLESSPYVRLEKALRVVNAAQAVVDAYESQPISLKYLLAKRLKELRKAIRQTWKKE